MIIKKRYLTVIVPNPEQIGHHEQKGIYDHLTDAVKHANRLAMNGAESVFVVSRANAFEAYNHWVMHYHAAYDVTDEEKGFYVVFDADITGELMAL